MAVLAVAVVAGAVAGTVSALAGGPAVTSAGENHPGDVLLVPGYGGSTTALDQLASKITAAGGRAVVVKLAAAVDADRLEPLRYRQAVPARQLLGQRQHPQVAQRPGQVAGAGHGEAGAGGPHWRQHPRVRVPRADLEELAFKRRPGRAAAEDLDHQRQPAGRVGPDVDVPDCGRRIGRRHPQAGRAAARDPHRRDHAELRPPAALGQQAQRQGRRNQVGRVRQPERLPAADLGEQLVAGIPDVGAAAADLIVVALAGVGQYVDPPPGGRCLPDPHLRHAIKQ